MGAARRVSEQALRDHLRLHLAAGVGATTFRRLCEAFGAPGDVLAARPRDWRRVPGVGAKTAEAIAAVTDADVDEELGRTAAHHVQPVCLADAAYPAALKTIYDPPPVLYVRGELAEADAVAVGVVGSRRCTHYGMEQAERFGQFLGRAGLTVVSGGARGIDTAAHRGALAGGGRTLAVMGCGLAQTYPPENAPLFERIVAEGRGAIVSELPMPTAVLSGNFPTRNRIISGLSLGALVIEAARRSGALHTAREAAEQGRPVLALPGRVDSAMSAGTNELIREGATLVQNLDDVLEALGHVGDVLAGAEAAEQAERDAAGPRGLDAREQALYDALGPGERGLDELVRATGLDSARAAAAMTMLVLKGAVAQKPGNVFVRKR